MTTELQNAALAFVHAVRAKPQLGSDPGELDALEGVAERSMGGAFAAKHAPMAPLSWDQRVIIGSSFVTTQRVPLTIPFPAILVGVDVTIEPIGSSEGFAVPTLNSLDVQVDLDQRQYMTQSEGTLTPIVGAPAVRGPANFVTLASLGVGAGRLLGWVIPNDSATMGVTLRWKQGGLFYQSASVGFVWYARALTFYGNDQTSAQATPAQTQGS